MILVECPQEKKLHRAKKKFSLITGKYNNIFHGNNLADYIEKRLTVYRLYRRHALCKTYFLV